MGVLQGPILEQMQKKTLGEVLRVGRLVPATTSECIERIPVEPAQLAQRRLAPWQLTRGSDKNSAPARRVKARWIGRHRRMLRIHVKPWALFYQTSGKPCRLIAR